MKFFSSILKNTSAQVFSRIFSSGASFLVTILIARYLGITGYADIAKVTALVSFFYLCVDLGANAIFLQFEVKEQRFQDLLSFRLFIAFLVFLIIFLLTLVLPYNSLTTSGYSLLVKTGILLFSFSLFSRAVVVSTAAVFQQQLSYKNATKASLIGSVVMLILVLVFIFLHLSTLWILFAYVMGGFAEASVSLFLAKQSFVLSRPSKIFVKKLFLSSLPLTLLLFINLIYFRADMLLLSFLQKSSEVGIYDFAYKFFDFLIALPLFLSNSLYPYLISQEKNFRIQVKNMIIYTSVFFFLGLLLVPSLWFAAPLLIWVKRDFVASILPFRILVLSLPIFFATNILQWIFITKKKNTFLVIIYSLSLLINIVLNLLFIPTFSYNASAIITDFSEGLILLAMVVYMLMGKL